MCHLLKKKKTTSVKTHRYNRMMKVIQKDKQDANEEKTNQDLLRCSARKSASTESPMYVRFMTIETRVHSTLNPLAADDLFI